MRIKSLKARQIINGKGHPTLQVEVASSRNTAISSIPIAATKSKYEFFDEYDNDVRKFHNETLKTIIQNIERLIVPELTGKNSMDQEEIDSLILEIDNSLDRSGLGVNTLTAISQAIAKLGAMESDLPLFKYLRVLHDYTGRPVTKLNSEYNLPIPVLTVYQSSGHYRSRKMPVQEILVYPKSKFRYSSDLVRLFESLNHLDLKHSAVHLESLLKIMGIKLLDLDFKFNLGVDMAASRFKRPDDANYIIPFFNSEKVPFKGDFNKLSRIYRTWIAENNLSFVEDLFDEDDYSAWKDLHEATKEEKNIQIVADDLTATNLERLEKVSALECANNVIIKPSQVGTVTESIHFAQSARKLGHNLTVSYRFGETEDSFISDLAVGINAEYIRTGFYHGSEYIAKLNRLLRIEESVQ